MSDEIIRAQDILNIATVSVAKRGNNLIVVYPRLEGSVMTFHEARMLANHLNSLASGNNDNENKRTRTKLV